MKARQGVRYLMLEGLMVANPQTLDPVPRDVQTMGEILMRGNNVMKGYLKNPHATGEMPVLQSLVSEATGQVRQPRFKHGRSLAISGRQSMFALSSVQP